jgi:hypothetical protein
VWRLTDPTDHDSDRVGNPLLRDVWVPGCRIVYDKFHIMQHANDADRRAYYLRLVSKPDAPRPAIATFFPGATPQCRSGE